MNVLLLRPDPGNERFGLGPFFRVEPLGLEYIAAALHRRGHRVAIGDLRFSPSLRTLIRRQRPALVGISVLHALEYDKALELAREVRRLLPEAFVLVGGHAAAAFPEAMHDPAIDAICTDDGEEVVPQLVDALAYGRALREVPALLLRQGDDFRPTRPLEHRTSLDLVSAPARHLVEGYRDQYHCLQFRPVWLIETTRGCPFRCSFCAVWQLYERSVRERSIAAVVDDFEKAGPHVFVADDLFFHHPDRSRELALALRRRGIRKKWLLVQSRADMVARHAELLEAWRPVAEMFDLFFGFEAASNAELARLSKDARTDATVDAIAVARSMDFGVTGNFVIDPDWGEEQFRELWDFAAAHRLQRAGYTILTPLPGTRFFDEVRSEVAGHAWYEYDMHHLLREPRLGARRFFELYAETWRRSVLNVTGNASWTTWIRKVRPRDVPFFVQVLVRTQRLMKPEEYLREHRG